MKISNSPFHLTYCSNIHPGESWQATFEQLKNFLPQIKKECANDGAMGIGLRLSNQASLEILENHQLSDFKEWLNKENLYVFTMNGFPYGAFHRTVVKDQVHAPDWTTKDRVDYTIRLFEILETLLPSHVTEGSISTSPLSYKYWDQNNEEVIIAATKNLIEVVKYLYRVKQETGKLLHLDLEPEPDGILENTHEVIDYFTNTLLPYGSKIIAAHFACNNEKAEQIIRNHLRICYDVCHYAIEFEEPREAFEKMEAVGIKVGKIQISAALQADFNLNEESNQLKLDSLKKFQESTYLHQVISKDEAGLTQYNDLPDAISQFTEHEKTWRIHFHVPLFLENYEPLRSTRNEIVKTLDYIKDKNLVNHLEIETYTWEVLPEKHQLPLAESITREMRWVLENLG